MKLCVICITCKHATNTITMKFLLYLRKAVYWLLPVIILSYVFSKIDFNQLINIIKTSEVHLLVMGVLFIQITVFFGAFRWFFLLEREHSFFYLAKHYWIGLSLGIFMPGSIGWDAYRVTIIGRKNGEYIRQISLLIWEKIIAMANVFIILLILYPFLTLTHYQNTLDETYRLMLIGISFFLLIVFIFRKQFVKKMISMAQKKLRNMVSGILNKFQKPYSFLKNRNITETFKKSISWKLLFYALIFSFFIQISSSISAQFFFQAIGYEISFWVNLFVTPLLFLIFILPISFGGIGIREASYIVIYNLFGVPLEIALLVSFLGLFSIMLNLLIGGLVLWLNRTRIEG